MGNTIIYAVVHRNRVVSVHDRYTRALAAAKNYQMIVRVPAGTKPGDRAPTTKREE